MRTPKILCIGEVLWDLFPEGAQFGGAPANVACHAALQHADVSLLTAVGHDKLGDQAVESLVQYGVNTGCVQRANLPTGQVHINIDEAQQVKYTIVQNVAWDELEYTPELESHLLNIDAVYYGTLSQRSATSRETIQRVLTLAKRLDIPRFLDVNLRPPFVDQEVIISAMNNASSLKCNEDELAVLLTNSGIDSTQGHSEVVRQLATQYNLEHVLITHGERGAMCWSGEDVIFQPSIEITNIQNTVGAGDSFMATFINGLIRREPIQSIMQHAAEIAAQVCQLPGALPAVFKK